MNLMNDHRTKGRFVSAVTLMSVVTMWMFVGSQAEAAATKVAMVKTDGSRETGFIQDSNKSQILFSYTAQTKGSAINRSTLKSITFQEESTLMGRGRQAFRMGAYEPAAAIFGKVATDYEGVSALDRNFASEARFFQMESLRRLGKYDELGALLETRSGKSIAATQDKLLGEQVQLMKMWAAFSGSKWDVVKAGLKFYEVPQVGDAKMLPAPVFKKMSKSTMIQLSYIRGKMYEQEKKLEHALEDYYRAFTITYGNQPALTKEAMLSALAIEAADPKLKDLQSKQWQMEGLAFYYKNGVGEGDIPAEYSQYAVLPDLPVGPVVPKEEKKEGEGDKAPAAEGDKKAEEKPEGGKAKKKAEEKPKGGKAKGTPKKKAEEKKAK